jgi:DHA1 family tetracycline resistance protein-like MFS transporter
MKKLFAGARAQEDMSTSRIVAALFFVNFVSISGLGMLLPIFAQLGEQIGASGTQITWAIASFALGQLLSGAVFGRLSDKYGRKPLMLLGMFASGFLYIGHLFATSPEILILARFGAGLASGCFALSFAAGADISTPATRARVLGIVGAGFSSGFIFGPAIGGFAAGLVAEESAFSFICLLSAAMSFAAVLAIHLLLPETRKITVHEEGTPRPRVRDLLQHRDFLTVLAICLAATTGMSILFGAFVLFANDVLLLGPLGIGLMYTVMGVFGVVTQMGLVGPIAASLGERWMLVVGMVIVFVGMVAVGATASVAYALLGLCVVAVGYSLVNTAATTLASFIAAESMQGAALGLVQAVTSLGRFLGPAVAGPIYDGQGPSAPFYWGAVVLLVFGVVTALWRPSAGHEPRVH